ncbi:ArgE/DapE family deacylase [Paenarthrobacter sp. AB444]|uniref:ArgE/DapE family deacylase n=1 Tax=Paenarthrobacter sp. AB444 TaxID=3025681 RepID=UPI0023669937|nr:ArgE/DapE family deacylase [Paenarthrobacter sp. AB444]MDD7833879.1 ArgE/DapE family deacylase [Paenarthrobacter sp. AB444]
MTTDSDTTIAIPHVMNPAELLQDLVRIDSVNPGLVSGAAGESEIASYASAWLESHGFTVTRLEPEPGRPSVVGVAAGTGGGKSLMFNGHLDTVTLAGYDGDALDPVVKDGRMFGRGAFDMKAGIAAIMVAAATAAARPHRGDIIVALVADEEYASAGTEEVLRHFRADGAIIAEPTHEDVVIAHRGFAWFDVTIHGTAAHGSRPDLGVDAIAKAGCFLTGLDNLAAKLAAGPKHPTLKTGNIHASLIRGGEEISSYPAECTISLERRTVPGENADTVEAELRAILDHLSATDPDFRYTLSRGLERQPFDVPAEEPIVQTLLAAAKEVSGKDLTLRGEAFWTDAALMLEAGIPGLLFGIDGGGAHAATEWIELDSLDRITSILTTTTINYCK